MQITFYGHSCVGVSCGADMHFIIDPCISLIPQASHINLNDLPCNYVLVSHGHGDHVADVPNLMNRGQVTLISNHEIARHYEQAGYEEVIGMNIGGSIQLNDVDLYMTSALHSSSFDNGDYAGNPAGFVISYQGKCCYFAGDTGLSTEMELLGKLFDIDCAMLPIGGRYTMDYKTAYHASNLLKTKKVIGIHYGAFESLRIDENAAKQFFEERNNELTLLTIGETIEL